MTVWQDEKVYAVHECIVQDKALSELNSLLCLHAYQKTTGMHTPL